MLSAQGDLFAWEEHRLENKRQGQHKRTSCWLHQPLSFLSQALCLSVPTCSLPVSLPKFLTFSLSLSFYFTPIDLRRPLVILSCMLSTGLLYMCYTWYITISVTTMVFFSRVSTQQWHYLPLNLKGNCSDSNQLKHSKHGLVRPGHSLQFSLPW